MTSFSIAWQTRLDHVAQSSKQIAGTFFLRPTQKAESLRVTSSIIYLLWNVLFRRITPPISRPCRRSVAVLEQEAHERVGFTRARATRKRKKAAP